MKLGFRTITGEDLEMILAWRTSPDVGAYMYTDFEPDIEQQRAWYEAIAQDPTRLDWIISVDGEDVGLVSITRIDKTHRRCEWAYYLASPSVRGKGVGRSVEMNVLSYVFEHLDLHKLCCEVFVSNETVIRIHEKYGSVVEGTRREHIQKHGRFHDIVEMGILRDDWERKIRGGFEYVSAVIEDLDKETPCPG